MVPQARLLRPVVGGKTSLGVWNGLVDLERDKVSGGFGAEVKSWRRMPNVEKMVFPEPYRIQNIVYYTAGVPQNVTIFAYRVHLDPIPAFDRHDVRCHWLAASVSKLSSAVGWLPCSFTRAANPDAQCKVVQEGAGKKHDAHNLSRPVCSITVSFGFFFESALLGGTTACIIVHKPHTPTQSVLSSIHTHAQASSPV